MTTHEHLYDRTGRPVRVDAADPPKPRPSTYRPPLRDETRGAVWSDLMTRIDHQPRRPTHDPNERRNSTI